MLSERTLRQIWKLADQYGFMLYEQGYGNIQPTWYSASDLFDAIVDQSIVIWITIFRKKSGEYLDLSISVIFDSHYFLHISYKLDDLYFVIISSVTNVDSFQTIANLKMIWLSRSVRTTVLLQMSRCVVELSQMLFGNESGLITASKRTPWCLGMNVKN